MDLFTANLTSRGLFAILLQFYRQQFQQLQKHSFQNNKNKNKNKNIKERKTIGLSSRDQGGV